MPRCKFSHTCPEVLSSRRESSLDYGTTSTTMGQWLIEVPNIRAQLAQQALSQCPHTKVVLSGYSQGGQLVHNAAKLLPAKTADKIAAAVTFGDPGKHASSPSPSIPPHHHRSTGISADHEAPQDNGQSFANIPAGAGKIYCHPLDNICQNGVLITPFHYSYSTQSVPAAANFVASKM